MRSPRKSKRDSKTPHRKSFTLTRNLYFYNKNWQILVQMYVLVVIFCEKYVFLIKQGAQAA